MSDDIVKRLRDESDRLIGHELYRPALEAADEIERLNTLVESHAAERVRLQRVLWGISRRPCRAGWDIRPDNCHCDTCTALHALEAK